MIDRLERLAGCTQGTAVGDALGLLSENFFARRVRRLSGTGPLERRFLFGPGMVSDEAEHQCRVGRALLSARDDVQRFARDLARRL